MGGSLAPRPKDVSRGKTFVRALAPTWLGSLFLLIGPPGNAASGPRWEYIGPGGAHVLDIAIAASNPKILYVVSDPSRLSYTSEPCTLFRSADGGSRWERMSTLSFPRRCDDLAVDAALPRVLFILAGGELYRSTNGGRSWTTLLGKGAVIREYVSCIATDPGKPATLYAGAGDGVLRSTDRGDTWSRLDLGPADVYVSALAVNPANSQVLYAGTEDGIYKSTNAGAAWVPATSGYPRGYAPSAICVAPSRPDTLYAGTDNGVFKSTNGGASWVRASSGLGRHTDVIGLSVDPGIAEIVYADTHSSGGYVTTDGGMTWRVLAGLPYDDHATLLRVDPSVPTTLYAGIPAGVFKSTDRGASWVPSSSGMHEGPVRAFAVDPENPRIVYAGTTAGVFKSTNGGSIWELSNGGNRNLMRVWSLEIDPKRPMTLYALADRSTFKSVDGGQSWKGEWTWFAAVAMDGHVPGMVYAGAGDVYRSTNWGREWQQCGHPRPGYGRWTIETDPAVPNVVYAGSEGAAMCRSTDAGSTWDVLPFASRSFSTAAPRWFEQVWVVTIYPGSPETVYVGREDWKALWKSDDGGRKWSRCELPGLGLTSLVASTGRPGTVYAGFSGLGVCRSADWGATWRAMNSGLTGSLEKRVHAISVAAPDAIYVGTDAGAFRAME